MEFQIEDISQKRDHLDYSMFIYFYVHDHESRGKKHALQCWKKFALIKWGKEGKWYGRAIFLWLMILLIVIDPKGLHSSSFFPAIVVLFECKCKEHLSHCFQHLEKVMIHRQQQYSEFRKLIAMRAKYFFIVLLSNRNYTGKMSFNHSKETLEMNVSLVWILFQALIHQCSLTPKCWAYQFLSFGCLIFTSLINIPPSLVLFVEVGGYIYFLCICWWPSK